MVDFQMYKWIGIVALLLTMAVGTTPLQAQDADSTAAVETADSPQTMQPDSTAVSETVSEESSDDKKSKKGDDDGGGFFSFFGKLKFWGGSSAPEEATEWHKEVRRYVSASEDEYYRFGYAKVDGKWVGTFFIRRFQMMEKQYSHLLIIQGEPGRVPGQKGVTVGPFGMEIRNNGFDIVMPKFPSVSRYQKKIDEQESIQLASMQLELYGFEASVWLEDRRKNFRDLADTWKIPKAPSQE